MEGTKSCVGVSSLFLKLPVKRDVSRTWWLSVPRDLGHPMTIALFEMSLSAHLSASSLNQELQEGRDCVLFTFFLNFFTVVKYS